MDLSVILQLFTNMDAFLVNLASNYGMMIYVVMFLIFYPSFRETRSYSWPARWLPPVQRAPSD